MSISIGAFTTAKLLAQPYGYEETDTSAGLTARRWVVSGLLTAIEWQSLISVYNNWRDARITDVDTLSSGSVGTTVSLTASANGISWSGIGCWFTAAPNGTQAGPYIQATVDLVDAAQALAVLLRQEEKNRQRSEALSRPALGTVTLGSAVLTLTTPANTYQDVPQLQLTASGTHYVNGPLTAVKVQRISGTTDSTGWDDVQAWYEETVRQTPAAKTWFPITAPTATAEVIISGGVKATQYTVSVDVVQVKGTTKLAAAVGTFTLTGIEAEFGRTYAIKPEAAAFILAGQDTDS